MPDAMPDARRQASGGHERFWDAPCKALDLASRLPSVDSLSMYVPLSLPDAPTTRRAGGAVVHDMAAWETPDALVKSVLVAWVLGRGEDPLRKWRRCFNDGSD